MRMPAAGAVLLQSARLIAHLGRSDPAFRLTVMQSSQMVTFTGKPTTVMRSAPLRFGLSHVRDGACISAFQIATLVWY